MTDMPCLFKLYLLNKVNETFNSSPNDKNLNFTKLKAFADDKSNVAKMMIALFCKSESTVGKQGSYI